MPKYLFVKCFNFHNCWGEYLTSGECFNCPHILLGIFQWTKHSFGECLNCHQNLNMGEGAKIEDKERGKGEVSGQWPIIDHIVPSNCKTLPTSAIQVSCFFGISSRRKEYYSILPLGWGWGCFFLPKTFQSSLEIFSAGQPSALWSPRGKCR